MFLLYTLEKTGWKIQFQTVTFNLPHCAKYQPSLTREVSGKKETPSQNHLLIFAWKEKKKKSNPGLKHRLLMCLIYRQLSCLFFICLYSRTFLNGCPALVHHIVSSVFCKIPPLHSEFLKPVIPFNLKFSLNLYFLWEVLDAWNSSPIYELHFVSVWFKGSLCNTQLLMPHYLLLFLPSYIFHCWNIMNILVSNCMCIFIYWYHFLEVLLELCSSSHAILGTSSFARNLFAVH